MVNVNPNNSSKQNSYKGTLERFTNNKTERFCIDLLFRLADTNKDGNVDEDELKALEKNLSEKSAFGDEVFDNKEFKDYVKEYNKPLKSDPSKKIEFSKEEMAELKDMKTGISKAMFDRFKEFCNIRLGDGDVNNQLGINGKLSLSPAISSKQDQTGDCYLLTAVNLLSRANGGDISDYIKPDGKGGAVISYKGIKNSQGGKFDAKVYERELNLVRKYQDEHPKSTKYKYGSAEIDRKYSILSKGDDDVLAVEIAEMKRKAFSRIKVAVEDPRHSKDKELPAWLKTKKTELLNNYVNRLSAADRNELSTYILQRKKIDPQISDLMWDMKVSDEEIRAFEFDDAFIQKIKDNPKAFEHLKFRFNQDCFGADGSEKDALDDECIANIREKIKLFYKNDDPRKNLCQDDEEILEQKRIWFEELIKMVKVEEGIQNGNIKLPVISKTEIQNYKITEDDLKLLYPPNKKSMAMCEKIDKYLMEHFSNLVIKDDDMLKCYHNLIDSGNNTNSVLSALAGADSIESENYEPIYKALGFNYTKKDEDKFDAKRKPEIKKWIDDAKTKGYPHIAVSIDSDHEVLFKDFDEKSGMVICYDPWDMNKEKPFSIGRISSLVGIKLPTE